MSARFTMGSLLTLLVLLWPVTAQGQAGIPALSVVSDGEGGQTYTLSLQVLALMTALTLLPSAALMMTCFTRIIIVLAILRQALGTAQTPANPVLIGLALFLSIYIMMPVLDRAYSDAVQPYLDEQIAADVALSRAAAPFRAFMVAQTREQDLLLLADLRGMRDIEGPEQTPFSVLVPAFLISELKTAFQIGFLIFLPFLIIDLVVASVLMSMGMMMLSPMIVSLPFKLMLFVMVDGWSLLISTLVSTFTLV